MRDMQTDEITEIGIDEQGRLYLCPAHSTFEYIYRAAMDVHWDETQGRLHSPLIRQWTYEQWFDQILAATIDEYGIRLLVTATTHWVNISETLQSVLFFRNRSHGAKPGDLINFLNNAKDVPPPVGDEL